MLVRHKVELPVLIECTSGIIRWCLDTQILVVGINVRLQSSVAAVQNMVVGQQFLANSLVVAERTDNLEPREDAVGFVVAC